MPRAAMVISFITAIMGCAALAAGMALPNWLDTGPTNSTSSLIIGYTTLGVWQSCYTLLGAYTCTMTTSIATTFFACKALITAGAAATLIAVIFILVYLCQNRACGTPRRLLTFIVVIQLLGVATGAAGCGVFYSTYLISFLVMSYAGYIYFAGLGLAFIAIVLTIVEIYLQREPDVEPEMEEEPVQREESDVSVIIHQPYSNPYADYQPPSFFGVPGVNPSPYAVPPPAYPPAYPPPPSISQGTPSKTPHGRHNRTAEWANQVANQYQQYYQNYYASYYGSQANANPANQIPVPTAQNQPVGPSAIQQAPIRTIFQQDDRDRGGIKVVQLGGAGEKKQIH